MRVFLVLIIFFSSLFFSPSFIFARDISIASVKSSLFGDEELTVTASASGFTADEQIYIKGAFFQEGTVNYFGYTKNNNDWIKNSASSQSQRFIKMNEWDTNLIVKNDAQDTGYKGNGSYKFKLGFYYITSGGNISSVNWSTNTLDIALSYPSPTPTPNPTSTPAPTNTPTPIPTKTPAPTLTPTRVVAKAITLAPTKKSSREVMGIQDQKADIEVPTPTIEDEDSSGIVLPSPFLLIGISIIITGCGILLFREWKKQKELEL